MRKTSFSGNVIWVMLHYWFVTTSIFLNTRTNNHCLLLWDSATICSSCGRSPNGSYLWLAV
jgi:hypothetical protein